MDNVIELGSLEGRLCGELAAALARYVTSADDGGKPGAEGAAFYHAGTSAFEATTVALTAFGLLSPVPRDDSPDERWLCDHALTIDADDMPARLAAEVGDGDGRLPRLLEAFLSVFCYYDVLCDGRDPFAPPPHLLAAVAMLMRAGYAERAGEQFRWTPLIGRAMQHAGLWDENFASIRDAEEWELDAEARLAWRTIPDTLRHAVLSGSVSVIEMTRILTLGWRDGLWRPYRLDEKLWFQGGSNFPLAIRLLEIAAGDE